MGPDASTQFPRASVAMQPHITTTLHPAEGEGGGGGVMQLLSEEDVVGVAAGVDKDTLMETHYTLPSMQPNPFIAQTQPKDVIFVERRGSLNFMPVNPSLRTHILYSLSHNRTQSGDQVFNLGVTSVVESSLIIS